MRSAPRILITGAPGCGKTTLVKAIARALDPAQVGGFITEEIREGGERMGFRVALLQGGGEVILAHVEKSGGPRVGRYGVDVAAFERVVLPFLEGRVDPRQILLLDEVGKMECLSARFRSAVARMLEGPSALVATVALRAAGFPQEIKAHPGAVTYHLKPQNRNEVQNQILKALEGWGK